jgi:hypothetical protein
VRVQESRVRKPANFGFQQHVVRLPNTDFDRTHIGVGDAFPQIVLKNSHSGECSLKLHAGIHEKVCANGLIVEREQTEQIRIPHLGIATWMVESAVTHLAEILSLAFGLRQKWRGITLKRDERVAFADAAIPLRFGK